MIYKFRTHNNNLKLEKTECTQIPAIGKKGLAICIDCDNNPVTGIVKGGNSISYFENGFFHNLYGPAKIRFNNDNFEFEWHYKGTQTNCKSQEEFEDYIKKVVFE